MEKNAESWTCISENNSGEGGEVFLVIHAPEASMVWSEEVDMLHKDRGVHNLEQRVE